MNIYNLWEEKKFIVKKKFDVKLCHLCIGHENVVKLLIENGADINRRDFLGLDYEKRPLQLAITKGELIE